MKKDLAPLQEKTAAALEDYKRWLQNDLLPPLRWKFPSRRGKVSKKTALRARFGPVDGRDHEARASRPETDAKTTIYETALPLYKKYFPTQTRQQSRTSIR